jgi:hypothetical protein
MRTLFLALPYEPDFQDISTVISIWISSARRGASHKSHRQLDAQGQQLCRG